MLKTKNIAFLVIILMVSYSIQAQELITDRPDQTESSSTVPKGSLQIESGVLLGYAEDDRVSNLQLVAPTTLFRLGLTEGIELRIVNQLEFIKDYESSKNYSGVSDLEIGTKIQLFQKEDVNTEIAFLSHLILPTGSKTLTNDNYGSTNKLSISHELNDDIGIGYNVGYNYFGGGDGDFTYSLALGYAINEKVGVYIEPFGEVLEFKDHLASCDAGLTYLVKENFQWDFSFGTGINHTMNYLAIGFSWLVFE
jgi:outer membrane putative beta-barrel porin/alpha-amylase